MQPPSVLKSILLTSLPTVDQSDFTAGTQLAKRNLEVFVMATSKVFSWCNLFGLYLCLYMCSSWEMTQLCDLVWDWLYTSCYLCTAFMDSVPLSCSMWLQGWPTRMFQPGIVTSRGEQIWLQALAVARSCPYLSTLLSHVLVLCMQGMWEHSNSVVWKQGWCEEQAGESQTGHISQEEKPAVLWDFS